MLVLPPCKGEGRGGGQLLCEIFDFDSLRFAPREAKGGEGSGARYRARSGTRMILAPSPFSRSSMRS